MSYTPDHHELDDPLRDLINTLEKVEKVLENRIEEQSWGNWSDEHVAECQTLADELTTLRRKLKRKWL